MRNSELFWLVLISPIEASAHDQIAVRVIDDRGNELLVVKSLKEAK